MSQPDLIVIDEEPNNIALYQDYLKESSYKTEYYSNASAALEKLESSRPRLLILAKEMSSMSSEQFMAKFSQIKKWEDMKILISSKEEIDKSEFYCLASLGANDVIVMGASNGAFLSKVEELYSAEM